MPGTALSLALLLLPTLGVTLLVGLIAVMCVKLHQPRVTGTDASRHEPQLTAWPSRPRVYGKPGVLALLALWATLCGFQPSLLELMDLWDPTTAFLLMPLTGIGFVLALLFVRPTDRSRWTLCALCLAVGGVCAAGATVSAYAIFELNACDLPNRNGYYGSDCIGCAWTSAFLFTMALSTARVYLRYGGRKPTRSTGADHVDMPLALRSLWKLLRIGLFIASLTFLSLGSFRLGWVFFSYKSWDPVPLSYYVWRFGDPILLIVGLCYLLAAACLSPRVRLVLQLGRWPWAWPTAHHSHEPVNDSARSTSPSSATSSDHGAVHIEMNRLQQPAAGATAAGATAAGTTAAGATAAGATAAEAVSLHPSWPRLMDTEAGVSLDEANARRRRAGHGAGQSASVSSLFASLARSSQGQAQSAPAVASAARHLPSPVYSHDELELWLQAGATLATARASSSSDSEHHGAQRRAIGADHPFAKLELLRPLGRGSFGAVYSALHPTNGAYAVKILGSSHDNRSKLKAPLEALISEVKLAMSMHHANVCATHGTILVGAVASAPGAEHVLWPALVMELADGGTLEDLIQGTDGGTPMQLKARIAYELALAVSHLHDAAERASNPCLVAPPRCR